jgi:quercetin dioxygenase-like cupin family protein
MRKSAQIVCLVALLIIAGALIGAAQTTPPAKPQDAAASQHTMLTPDQLKWGPAPPSLPAGAQMAVLEGDPTKPGLFSIRAKFPDGYSIAPHWHPTDEHVVVLSGTFMMGLGDKLDAGSMHALPAGGFSRIPRRAHHYARAKGETIIQVYGMGPFVLNYVNAGDDPRKKTTATK